MNLRKTFFILPNLFTLANIFCGFFAIALSAGATNALQLYQASLAIVFGFFFDLFDGRVARLTKTQSELGIQLDSLADVITFGAAPAMLVYKWGLTKFGLWGIFVAFLFLASAALRLARFNVLSARARQRHRQVDTGENNTQRRADTRYFVGLSTPAAAAVIVSLVVVHYRVGGQHFVYGQGAIALLVIVLSYLMISRVRFRTFKDFRVTRRSAGVVFVLVICSIVITTKLRASFVFIFLASAYIALGLTEEIYRFAAERRVRRRAEKLAAGTPLSAEDEEPEDDDEEILRELGEDRQTLVEESSRS